MKPYWAFQGCSVPHRKVAMVLQVESSKRYSFLEILVCSLFAHQSFFKAGHDMLRGFEVNVNSALEIGKHLRAEENARGVRCLICVHG